jgi:hypothetical protein
LFSRAGHLDFEYALNFGFRSLRSHEVETWVDRFLFDAPKREKLTFWVDPSWPSDELEPTFYTDFFQAQHPNRIADRLYPIAEDSEGLTISPAPFNVAAQPRPIQEGRAAGDPLVKTSCRGSELRYYAEHYNRKRSPIR